MFSYSGSTVIENVLFFTCKSVFQTRCVGAHQDTSGSGAGALCGVMCALAIREDGLAIDVRDIVGTADAV